MPEDPNSLAPQIDIIFEDPAWDEASFDVEDLVHRAAVQVLRRELSDEPINRSPEVCLVLTDDLQVQTLNRGFRGQDKPTNVLSFSNEGPKSNGGAGKTPAARSLSSDCLAERPWLLGDVILARQTIGREAMEQQKPLENHLAHLVVHGVLHLLGYDHDDDRDAALMERQEISILSDLGIPDPYEA
ncbi:MAG: rRNA maturation RNase YbeY [Pseudomonadota bacterium]